VIAAPPVSRVHEMRPGPEPEPIVPASLFAKSMGGRLVVHLQADGRVSDAERSSRRVVARIDRWAARLTRYTDESDLSMLNADLRPEVPIRPTLAAALRAGQSANETSEGLADITLLDARLAAEGWSDGSLASGEVASGEVTRRATTSREGEWLLSLGRRGAAVVRRPPGLRFDLGGVGKGWIADRALEMLTDWPSAVIDADGDLAIRCAPGRYWEVAVEDPRTPDANLAVLRLGTPAGGFPERWGVATSGVSIHRWEVDGKVRHHLIDPRTGFPAETDVVQATVVAGSSLRAEALAKAAVIAGAVTGFALLERARVRGAILLTDRGEVLALPSTLQLLAG
jgi:thiamine biosynthesis lipoprotein